MTGNTPHLQDDSHRKARIEVARSSGTVLIRMIGLGGMNAALTLRDFINDCLQDPCDQVLLDLADCKGMDSTFMGTLISLAATLREQDAVLRLYNITRQCRQLLQMLGVDQLLDMENTVPFPNIEFTCMCPLPGDPRRRLELIRHAHECLVDADEKNRERFGKFLEMLSREMDESPDKNN